MQATAQQTGTSLFEDKKIDSLLRILKSSKEDVNKVNTLDGLYQSYGKNNNQTEAEKYNDEAWLLSKKIAYIKGEARSMVNKAFLCKKEKKWEKMLQYSLSAAGLLKNTDDTLQKARCASLTGDSYYFRSIYPDAIKYYTESVWYWKELKNDSGAIYTNLKLSGCLTEIGNYTLALEKEFEALDLSIKIGNKPLEALSNQSVANSYSYLKKYKKAGEFLEKAIKINQATGDQFQLAQNQNSLAEILIEENDFLGAEKYISTALKIYETQSSSPSGKQWCYTLFGRVNECRGDSAFLNNNKKYTIEHYKSAVKYFTTALKLCEEINSKILIAEKYVNLGRIYRKLHNYSLSRTYILKAIPLTKDLGVKDLTVESYHELSSLDSMEGDFKSAFENGKLYKIYSDSLALETEKGKVESFTIQAEMNKKEEEIKLLGAENKLKIAESEKENQRRKFAYAAIGAVLLLSAFGFYRYRRFSRMRAEQKLLKDRLQISQDLHDSIGSTLSSISVYSQVAKIQGKKNEEEDMNELLEKISNTSNEMVTEMNDIVWAINPGNDSMEKIIQRMESFARPLAAARNIQFDLHHDSSILALQLDMDKRKNFYLIFKEAVTNAIKYSGASELLADIQSANNKIVLTVNDNGVGFNPEREMAGNSATLSGNGLKNMHARAAELKGELQIHSQSGKGTAITLQFPHA